MSQSTQELQLPATPASTSDRTPATRPARSKNGCNACRRRKVRCNERRPRCAHCERLNLDCTWNRPLTSRSNTAQTTTSNSNISSNGSNAHVAFNPNLLPLDGYPVGGNAFFDFSGPLGIGTWDDAMLLSPSSWPPDLSGNNDRSVQPIYQLPLGHQSAGPLLDPAQEGTRFMPDRSTQNLEPTSTSPFSAENAPNGSVDESFLLDTFLQMLMPPILSPVEVGPKWESVRAFFAAMASESLIVKSAILAFAAMQLQRTGLGGDTAKTDWRPLYDSAARHLSSALAKRRKEEDVDDGKTALKHILASLFLLTYTDLLAETLPRAHGNLREAYTLVHKGNKASFSVSERRLISWLRLLDARAVSTAGGEGLFLADTDETFFDASPAPVATNEPETLDTEIEEMLFDVLYHPGIVFYQKVQSFVGRITRIDPWHRGRGTVQDETEVMGIAAQISKDLHALYGQRPALMDHAVAGNLTEKHLAKNLAAALTRSFRTYLANYYASFLHLHRVAYVQYPKTKDVLAAIANIKRLSHLMAQTDESLPVNLLWPLLMWGAEEDSTEERGWIVDAIRGLESIATNAKPTADLLEEVQRRQDECKRRVDVRSVSQEYFASHHFAIV
ncbi:fungal-specific transcription factor domain-containing protein [Phaeosphaeria sp. MPI-PUGE-AT-0046c]|nr:fungal-specific transcription factor domain-containing protein [Phaeosphaeria sp. MPI-PUGE-AT-0046c]